nr:PepSY domain-containing protein [Corynebacterium xerosis]
MPETSAARRAIRDRPARFLHRLHFYAGLMVGPFLLVAAISGAFYALAPTVEKVVYADLLTVAAAPHSVSVGEQVEAAAATSPGSSVAQIWPAHDPGDTTRVLFDDPSSTDKTLPAAFVDPATAAVVGEERTYSGLGELPLRRWLSGLHQHLHLGEPGELYAELAASWVWVLALGGLYLWWRRVSAARRRDPGTRNRLWRAAPAPRGDAGRRPRRGIDRSAGAAPAGRGGGGVAGVRALGGVAHRVGLHRRRRRGRPRRLPPAVRRASLLL